MEPLAPQPQLPLALRRTGKGEPFSFLFITDAHLQPELNGVIGTDMAMKKARTFKADFAINGGDHVFDSLGVPKSAPLQLFDLYAKTEQDLGLKVYHTVGNHDVLGIYPASGIAATDPSTARSSLKTASASGTTPSTTRATTLSCSTRSASPTIMPTRAASTPSSLHGSRAILPRCPQGTPIIVSVHIPLVSAFASYIPAPATPAGHQSLTVANANEVLDLFEGHNVIGVLQGHTHINENVDYKGVTYITSGAICGNWWKGSRMGTPEGFTVVNVANGRLTTHYETYGFKAVAS